MSRQSLVTILALVATTVLAAPRSAIPCLGSCADADAGAEAVATTSCCGGPVTETAPQRPAEHPPCDCPPGCPSACGVGKPPCPTVTFTGVPLPPAPDAAIRADAASSILPQTRLSGIFRPPRA